MEVIVDDSQLSLAIGKKGQNVRLAAKLLGWKIDIKSEEEKRQEVQNAIELLSTGAPVSALIEHGLAEATVDALVKGDIGTVEKLGSMTPEAARSARRHRRGRGQPHPAGDQQLLRPGVCRGELQPARGRASAEARSIRSRWSKPQSSRHRSPKPPEPRLKPRCLTPSEPLIRW